MIHNWIVKCSFRFS